ncbi:hypothetical protein F4779DRAFT_562283 [Xylariaceae sp. FL0662B]|nr:hypothetical protein F4779DRAFT_562283 [Xylariaceae sp. FL0662B]
MRKWLSDQDRKVELRGYAQDPALRQAFHIACTQDPISRPEASIPPKEGGFLPDLEEVTVDSGHWVPLEKPEEVTESMKSFLQRRFPA